jgi:hypothetical protein
MSASHRRALDLLVSSARRTPHRIALKTLLREEFLFAYCEMELLTAVLAPEDLILCHMRETSV